MSVKFDQAWAGLYLHSDTPINTTGYDTLRFWVNGGNRGGQKVDVGLNFNGDTFNLTPHAGTWKQISIPLADLGAPSTISDMVWQDAQGASQPVFYLDDIALVNAGLPTPTPVPPGTGPALSVDAAANRHAISPYIYGMNFPSQTIASALNLPVARWGGNSTSRYNWQNDTTNTGSDWYFENVPDDVGASDSFVEQNISTSTQTLLTVHWVGGKEPSERPSLRLRLQDSADTVPSKAITHQWDPDCGNGIRTDGTPITGITRSTPVLPSAPLLLPVGSIT